MNLIVGLIRALTRGVAMEAFQGLARDQSKRCTDHQVFHQMAKQTSISFEKKWTKTKNNALEPHVTRVHTQKRYA